MLKQHSFGVDSRAELKGSPTRLPCSFDVRRMVVEEQQLGRRHAEMFGGQGEDRRLGLDALDARREQPLSSQIASEVEKGGP
jgi:hypothetical protein